jgi:hypothetical protein
LDALAESRIRAFAYTVRTDNKRGVVIPSIWDQTAYEDLRSEMNGALVKLFLKET